MSGAARNNGSKLVVAAVALTLTAAGVGTVYLPFFADRDRLRGMHEEGEMSDADKKEYERAMSEMSMKLDQANPTPPPSNSMWKRMNDAATQRK
jgi:hypothetical protein